MKFLKIFNLNNIKRTAIFCLITIIALSAIIFGSIFYTSPKTVLGAQYQTSAQYVLKVDDARVPKWDLSELSQNVANSVKDRLDGGSNLGVEVQAEIKTDVDKANNQAIVRITYPNVVDQAQLIKIQNLITNKPNLIATDYYTNPLFDENGNFNSTKLKIGEDPGQSVIDVETFQWQDDPVDASKKAETKIPLKPEEAQAIYENSPIITAELKDQGFDGEAQWGKAVEYVSSLPSDEKKVIIFWINIPDFINFAKTDTTDWLAAGKNPYFYAFVGNKPFDENNKPNILKTNTINASDYLISNSLKFKDKQTTEHFRFELSNPQISRDNLNFLVNQINYGSATYQLNTINQSFSRLIPAQFNSYGFNYFLIAILVIFALLTCFFVFNYGFLGVISSLSLALLGFLIWTFFNLMGGVFTPLVIAGFVFMLGFFVDKTLVFFDRIKEYVTRGDAPQKAVNISRIKTTPFVFDSHNISLILGIGLFYFGAATIWGFSLMLLIGILCSIFTALLFSNFLSTLIINTGWLNNRPLWMGIKASDSLVSKDVSSSGNNPSQITKIQPIKPQLNKPINFLGFHRFAWYGLISIIVLAIIIMCIFIGINQSFAGGFNLSQGFSGGSNIQFIGQNGTLTDIEFNQIHDLLINNGVKSNEIIKILDNNVIVEVTVSVNRNLNLSAIQEAFASQPIAGVLVPLTTTVLNNFGSELIIGLVISISVALGFIMFYMMIRYRWTFALIILTTVILDLLVVISCFIIFRLSFNFEFIVALLIGLIYSMNNHIMMFSQIKTRSSLHLGIINKQESISIANQSIQSGFKRNLLSAITLMILFIIVGSFAGIISLSLTLAVIFSVIMTTISSLFIAPWIWSKLETRRQVWIKRRVDSKFWDINEQEEQTFNGINNFRV